MESTIFSPEHLKLSGIIHHDPGKFALAVRTLLYARSHLNHQTVKGGVPLKARHTPRQYHRSAFLLCNYWATIRKTLADKNFRPKYLRDIMSDLVWENRDIRIEHLAFFDGVRIVSDTVWNRSTEWDNVLGYYDPKDRFLKIHGQLLHNAERLRGNVLIALGESLLGRYIATRRWIESDEVNSWGSRCYEIQLQPPQQRECFLKPAQLHAYLQLARMIPHPRDPLIYRITLNNDDGFIPPGLLFGLMYAWYLDNSYGPIIENEMSLLHLPETTLIPHQVKEYRRKKALIDFFRNEVFGYAQ